MIRNSQVVPCNPGLGSLANPSARSDHPSRPGLEQTHRAGRAPIGQAEREAVVFPAGAVRDGRGQIVGCTSLGTFLRPDARDA